jgi:hypothetical protein
MRVGSLVKHRLANRLGIIYKTFWQGEIVYVRWALEPREYMPTRQKPHNIEVIHE